jgi:hypothetical protein
MGQSLLYLWNKRQWGRVNEKKHTAICTRRPGLGSGPSLNFGLGLLLNKLKAQARTGLGLGVGPQARAYLVKAPAWAQSLQPEPGPSPARAQSFPAQPSPTYTHNKCKETSRSGHIGVKIFFPEAKTDPYYVWRPKITSIDIGAKRRRHFCACLKIFQKLPKS